MGISENVRWLLIVEDDPDFAALMSGCLSQTGLKCVVSGKVADGLLKLRNQKFEIILLDMYLEQGTGERIVDVLREDKKCLNFDTPILVVSGQLDPGLVRRVGTKVSGMIVKPFNKDDLLAKVQKILKAKSAPPQS